MLKVAGAVLAVSFGVIGISALAQTSMTKLGKGEGRVDIVAWPGYIERGASDKIGRAHV